MSKRRERSKTRVLAADPAQTESRPEKCAHPVWRYVQFRANLRGFARGVQPAIRYCKPPLMHSDRRLAVDGQILAAPGDPAAEPVALPLPSPAVRLHC